MRKKITDEKKNNHKPRPRCRIDPKPLPSGTLASSYNPHEEIVLKDNQLTDIMALIRKTIPPVDPLLKGEINDKFLALLIQGLARLQAADFTKEELEEQVIHCNYIFERMKQIYMTSNIGVPLP